MSPIDPIIQYATQQLGGRTMPDDLRRLLNLQWRAAAGGRSDNLLKDAGVTFLDGGRMPRLIAAVCTGRDDLEGAARLAYAQAMGDMVRYSGFGRKMPRATPSATGLAPTAFRSKQRLCCASTRMAIFPFCPAMVLRKPFWSLRRVITI